MTSTTTDRDRSGPVLPAARGPLSAGLLAALAAPHLAASALPDVSEVAAADPYGEDLHLALYTLYELHYRGFADVSEDREWDPELMPLRQALEKRFLGALRTDVPTGRGARGVRRTAGGAHRPPRQCRPPP